MSSKTSTLKLSCGDFEALLRFSETATAIIGMHELLRIFPLNGQKILTSGAFSEEQHALTVVPSGCDQEKDVEWNDDLGGYAYFSTRGWVKIDADLLRRYKLNTHWVVDQILQGLSWPHKAEPLLDGVLWNCGQSYIGKNRVSVFVGRRVAHPEVFADIQKKLTPRCRSGANILLTTSQHIEPCMSISGATIIPLVDIFDRRRKHFALDKDIVSSVAFGQTPDQSNDPVVCKANGHVLILNSTMRYEFKGEKHAAVIQYLCDRYHQGITEVRVAQMLEDLEDVGIKSPRLKDLFSGHPHWGKALTEKDGTCWLIVE